MDRDNRGRFARGHAPSSPGRPRRSVEERLLGIMREETKDEDWRAITRRAVSDAKRGDDKARVWLSNYLLGAPRQTLDATIWNAQMLDAFLDRAAGDAGSEELSGK